MAGRLHPVHFVLLLFLGALLTPLAGYLGAVVFPDAALVWVAALFFTAVGGGFEATVALFAVPAVYGANLAWPVTCLVFPTVAAVLTRTTVFTPLLFLAIGAASGAAMLCISVRSGLYLINPNDLGRFVLAGTVSGATMGIIFGFVVWRIDEISRKEPAAQA